MSCERFKTRLLDFALGAEDAALRSHIDACSSCRAELDAHRALVSSMDRGVASMAAGEPSGDFAAQVRRRIAQEGGAPRPWFSAWLPITAAAALVLVAFVALLTIGRPPQTVRVTPPALVAPTGKPPGAVRTEAPPLVAADRRPSRGRLSAAKREPEVLVPRGEMAAVMRLYNATWNGQADGASLMAAAMPTSEFLKPLPTSELKI